MNQSERHFSLHKFITSRHQTRIFIPWWAFSTAHSMDCYTALVVSGRGKMQRTRMTFEPRLVHCILFLPFIQYSSVLCNSMTEIYFQEKYQLSHWNWLNGTVLCKHTKDLCSTYTYWLLWHFSEIIMYFLYLIVFYNLHCILQFQDFTWTITKMHLV